MRARCLGDGDSMAKTKEDEGGRDRAEHLARGAENLGEEQQHENQSRVLCQIAVRADAPQQGLVAAVSEANPHAPARKAGAEHEDQLQDCKADRGGGSRHGWSREGNHR